MAKRSGQQDLRSFFCKIAREDIPEGGGQQYSERRAGGETERLEQEHAQKAQAEEGGGQQYGERRAGGDLETERLEQEHAQKAQAEEGGGQQYGERRAGGDLETERLEQEHAQKPRAEEEERGREEETKAGQDSADKGGPSCQGDDQDIPDCWTVDTFRQKKELYPWLICQNKKLGCLTCQSIKSLVPNAAGSHAHAANEWAKVLVTIHGATREAQLQCLRKKIHKHRTSEYHQAAEKSIESAKEKKIETMTVEMQRDHFLTTDRVFRTVYKIAKAGRPFTDLPNDIDLQVLNGLNMGRTLHSDHSCAAISQHIAQEMRARVVLKVLQSETKFSVLIDESTTDSKKSALIIYIRASLGRSEDPLTFFLDLVELPATNANSIYQALMSILSHHGFSEDVLRERFVCFASDGASVMLGSKSGVATKIVEKFPNVMVWHCMNHRLELSVGDTVEEIAGMNDFQFFFDKLYSLYHASAKNRHELNECCAELALQCHNIGRILSTRWVASSCRTIRAVWNQYPALHKHFSNASDDPKRSSTERCMFNGLKKRLADVTFVHNLGIMYDALEELAEFSLSLQHRSTTLPKAEASLSQQVRVLKSMAEQPGPRAEEAQSAAELQVFKEIPLTNNARVREINQNKFFHALAARIEDRMGCLPGKQKNREEYQSFLNNLKVLQPSNWPDSCSIRYAEKEIQELCSFFNLHEERRIQRGMREYIDMVTFKDADDVIRPPEDLKPLLQAVDTLVISTAECERGFSQMNLLTTTRSSLEVSNMSALLFIKCVGPPLKWFKPELYVKSWLKHHCLANDQKARTRNTEDKRHEYEILWKCL